MKIIWFGTASIMIEVKDEKLLFDPFFRLNKKLESPKLEDFCEADYIFNTHPHFDHLCDVPQILEKSEAKIYGTQAMFRRLKAKDVDVDNKVRVITPAETLKTKYTKITPFKTKHIKNNLAMILQTTIKGSLKFQFKKASKILKIHNEFRMGDDIYAYEIDGENKRVLIFGSAGLDESQEIPTNVDVLIWPFQGRTNMTKYSLPIIERINPKMIILSHFDDALPPITGKVNTSKFVKVMNRKHPEIKVIVPKYKQEIEIK